MYAILVEVETTPDVDMPAAVQNLKDNIIPGLREAGACGGYWLGGSGTTRVAVLLFETEDEANAVAGAAKVGDRPTGGPEGMTISRLEVSEVVASL